MCAVAVTVAKECIFTLTRVKLVKCSEVFGCVLTSLDKCFYACNRRFIGARVVGDPFTVSVERVDIILRGLIGAGGADAA